MTTAGRGQFGQFGSLTVRRWSPVIWYGNVLETRGVTTELSSLISTIPHAGGAERSWLPNQDYTRLNGPLNTGHLISGCIHVSSIRNSLIAVLRPLLLKEPHRPAKEYVA